MSGYIEAEPNCIVYGISQARQTDIGQIPEDFWLTAVEISNRPGHEFDLNRIAKSGGVLKVRELKYNPDSGGLEMVQAERDVRVHRRWVGVTVRSLNQNPYPNAFWNNLSNEIIELKTMMARNNGLVNQIPLGIIGKRQAALAA